MACKVEDTIKKSKDILCAAYNIKNPEHPTTPDDKVRKVDCLMAMIYSSYWHLLTRHGRSSNNRTRLSSDWSDTSSKQLVSTFEPVTLKRFS